MDQTARLRSLIDVDGQGLEIGPSYNPLLPKFRAGGLSAVSFRNNDCLAGKAVIDPCLQE
ncbi:hypothetical protein [uncultured Phyllobacterium sp.]|uniref:hypothetical protein n=1 Tax=uncultured Phyllobacterium sp. TaxID=253813 RepID=UPI0025832E60|nr:hypothetical protein [uncultured Phyllobacterium sp.]